MSKAISIQVVVQVTVPANEEETQGRLAQNRMVSIVHAVEKEFLESGFEIQQSNNGGWLYRKTDSAKAVITQSVLDEVVQIP